jgi:hypothetical protein
MPSSQAFTREPAYCLGCRFATRVAVAEASPRRDQSLRGHTFTKAEGFPRHGPPPIASSLVETDGEGFAVMSGIDVQSHLRTGQLFTRQGISLP